MMPRFFYAHSVEEARRSIPPGAPRPTESEGSISSLPMASLKHIARAAQIAAQDLSISRRLELLILQGDARGLARYLEKLGEEGKLGQAWVPQDFLSARGIKRTKSRAGKRTTRRRAETNIDILRRRAVVVARRISRRVLSADDLALLSRFDAAPSIPRPHGQLGERSYEAIDNLDEMMAVLPHVKPVDPRTWRKLSELAAWREMAQAFLKEA